MDIQKVLISDPTDQEAANILTANGVQVDVKTGLSEAQIKQLIPEYDGLIVRSATQVTSEVIREGRRLKVIGRAGVGIDNIHLETATENGVLVLNAPAGNTLAATELTCALILGLSRHIVQACSTLKGGTWDKKSFTGDEVSGKTLAIVGLGKIGKEVAIRMQSFGMITIGYDPIVTREEAASFNVEWLDLEQLWPRSDYITVHVPLIPATKYLLNERTMSSCPRGVKIVNVARGGIIDESALYTLIQSGHVGGAALDVFEEEPPNNHNLLQSNKVLCTPHLGASTREAQRKVAIEVANQFVHLKNGQYQLLTGAVNRQVLQQ